MVKFVMPVSFYTIIAMTCCCSKDRLMRDLLEDGLSGGEGHGGEGHGGVWMRHCFRGR